MMTIGVHSAIRVDGRWTGRLWHDDEFETLEVSRISLHC